MSCDTVTAQLLYELGDPKAYLTPDITADFSTIELAQQGPDRVRVHGIKGHAPTPTYKVSMSYTDGYKVLGELTCAGPTRPRRPGSPPTCCSSGWRWTAPPSTTRRRPSRSSAPTPPASPGMLPPADPYEVVLRIGVREYDKRKADRFGGELASMVLAGPRD